MLLGKALLSELYYHSASLHPGVFKGIPAYCQRRLTKILEVWRLFTVYDSAIIAGDKRSPQS